MPERQPVLLERQLRGIGQRAALAALGNNQGLRLAEIIGDDSTCYDDIASELREFPRDKQLRFLRRGFGPEGANFHNWQVLADLLVRINNIDLSQTPRPTLGEIQAKIDEQQKRLMGPPLKATVITTRKALSSHYHEEQSLRLYLNGVYPITSKTIWPELGESEGAVEGALTGLSTAYTLDKHFEALGDLLASTIVYDLLKSEGYDLGNPAEPALELLEMGVIQGGVICETRNKRVPKIAVYILPRQDTAHLYSHS